MWRTPKQDVSSRGVRAARTNALAEETQDMESRLEDLRRAMDKERAKRNRLINRMASGGAIWGNSQSDPCKKAPRNSTRKETPSSATTAAQFQALKTKGTKSKSKNPADEGINHDTSDRSNSQSYNPNTPELLPGKTNRSFRMNSPFKKSGVKSKNASGVGDAQAFIAHSKEQHSVSTGCDASTTPFKNITKNSSSSCFACTSTEPLPETNKIHAAVMETQTEPGTSSTQRSEKVQDEDPDGLYFSRLFMRECSTQASKQAAEKTDCSKPEVAIDQPVPAISGDPMETQKTIPMSLMANPNYEAISCTNHFRHPIGPRSADGSTASASTDGDSLDHEVKFQSVQLCLTSGIRLPDKIVVPQSE